MKSQRLCTVLFPLVGAAALVAATAREAYSEFAAHGGHTVIPDSSVEQPEHIGVQAHTNFKMFVPNAGGMAARQNSPEAKPQNGGPPYPGYLYETPASLACVYKLVSDTSGCNPNIVIATVSPSASPRAIAIVDAYHYPRAASDLAVFSNQFGLPLPTTGTTGNFQVVFANGRQPPVNANWNIEEALDIQWAHAMAPGTKIYLVEAASASYGDLLNAVSVANRLLSSGGGEVSMSWGGSEFSFETYYDGYFTQPRVVYFAASGDSPGVIWPSTSPNLISTGGTSVSRNLSTGAFQMELAWQSTGGGPSAYESRPTYQNVISSIVQGHRGTPDVAADADPSTGVWVYAYPYWYIVGGTSVSTPVWAGIVNSAGRVATSSQNELTTIYQNLGSSNFTDIVHGSCGPNQGYLTITAGWNFCTGVGSPLGYAGK